MPTGKNAGYDDPEYRLYLEERRLLYEGESHQADSFDKAILTLSSGAFGISIAFLDKITKNLHRTTLWLLISSWALFAVSILSTLLSFHTSQRDFSRQLRRIEQAYLSKYELKQQKRDRTGMTQCLNVLSLVAFFVAIAFLSLFVILNL